jgi:hypothetical protein
MTRERIGGWVLTVEQDAIPSWDEWLQIAQEQDPQAEVLPDDHDCPMLHNLMVVCSHPQGQIRFTRTINLLSIPDGVRGMREPGYFPGPCMYIPRCVPTSAGAAWPFRRRPWNRPPAGSGQ